MRFRSLALVAFVLLSAVVPARAADGLRCFKVRDTQGRSRSVATVTDEGGSQKCRVRLPATIACVPTSTALTPPVAGLGAEVNASILCYAAKCTRAGSHATLLADQFGARSVTLKVAQTLCWPAAAAPGGGGGGGPAATTTTSTLPAVDCGNAAAPACNGRCNSRGETCIPEAGGGCHCEQHIGR